MSIKGLKIKKRKQFKYAKFETACMCENENFEENFNSHFSLHVHLIVRSQKLISQKQLQLLNLSCIQIPWPYKCCPMYKNMYNIAAFLQVI